MIILFNNSGRIFRNEIVRMQKISFPGKEACVLAGKYFMEELCLPMWISGGSSPAWGSSSCARNESNGWGISFFNVCKQRCDPLWPLFTSGPGM